MGKRFGLIFFITLGSIIFIIAAFLLVLFLAPGFSLFGLRYIAMGTHTVDKKITLNSMEYPGFNRTVFVETHEVPVEIYFSETVADQIEVVYHDDYNGLTATNIENPEIEITQDEYKSVHIKINEFRKFIYENTNSSRLLQIKYPLFFMDGAGEGLYDLTVDSGSASIKLAAENYTDERVPAFKNLTLKTSANVSYEKHAKAQTFSLETDPSIIVEENGKNVVEATNYNLKSNFGKIEFQGAVSGNITAETKNFSIYVVSCNNLEVKSAYGSLYPYKENQIVVNGKMTANLSGGSVNVGEINGALESTIATTSGDVNIKKANELSINTTRGNINLGTAKKATIVTNVGKTTVEEITDSISVNSKRGKVVLGTDGEKQIHNPTVETRLGKVTLKNTAGNVKVDAHSSDVEIENNSSNKFELNVGGKLTATKLEGEVTLTANKDVVLNYKSFNGNLKAELGSDVRVFDLYALSNKFDNINYSVKMTEGKGTVKFKETDNDGYSYTNLDESRNGQGVENITNLSNPSIIVDAVKANATVTVYLSK
ncbi:MAG: hypothetical protein IJ538_02490 [Clostridia bacterium]|nr:hypothetical protein [Clostridia bacterium]